MEIVQIVEQYVKDKSEEYKKQSEEHYDFWNEHIKYVYEESKILAQKYNANVEIIALGALLHDIALIEKVGSRKEHHLNGAQLAQSILEKYNYPQELMDKVIACVLHHRSSRNVETIEELCVADADVLAHFDNIPMLFNSAYNRNNISLNEVRDWLKTTFEKDYNDLSNQTKTFFEEKYNIICQIVLGEK